MQNEFFDPSISHPTSCFDHFDERLQQKKEGFTSKRKTNEKKIKLILFKEILVEEEF